MDEDWYINRVLSAIPQYDEETQRWFSMKFSGGTMYVQKGLHPFNSQIAPDQQYAPANTDEYNGSVAIGNGRVVFTYRPNSGGQPRAFSWIKTSAVRRMYSCHPRIRTQDQWNS